MTIVDRETSTDIWDLEAHRSLGAVIPPAWAREAARRDFSGDFEEVSVYLHPRSGPGIRQAGVGPETLPLPTEYAGPLPAYAFRLRPGGTHLYVDALTGDLRARRTSVWRAYDLAFRLHGFDFTWDGIKRGVIWATAALWLGVGMTGTLIAIRKPRKRA